MNANARKFFFTLFVGLAMWPMLLACQATPGKERVSFEAWIAGAGGAEPFENVPPDGVEPWTVALEEAWAALGPVYLFEGEPLLGRLDGLRTLFIPHALAHPGHYQEGEALGEALDQRVVDLLDGEPTLLGPMNGVTGECNSARIGLGTAQDGLARSDQLEGHALLLRGVAHRGEEVVAFRAWLDVDLYIEGVDFEHSVDSSEGSLLVEVDLTRWLRRVDFSTAEADADGQITIVEATQAHNALVRGVDNTLAYRLTWRSNEREGS